MIFGEVLTKADLELSNGNDYLLGLMVKYEKAIWDARAIYKEMADAMNYDPLEDEHEEEEEEDEDNDDE